MDIQQMKLLAARVRALLQQANCTINHGQALDLTAALPGLRNWPEVQSFPDRLTTTQLDATSLGRLAFRLQKRCNVTFTREELLAALDPQARPDLPQIWPLGPAPGVYLTTEQAAINALLERFEEASDGALVYAERAGSHWAGSIDLGEGGLWSSGLQRVPSGTLIVVGPLDFEQSSWEDSAQRLVTSCYKAYLDGHRVAVLINTPTPERMCEDAFLMVRSDPDADGLEESLCGIVTDEGELEERKPFQRPASHRAFTSARQHAPRSSAIPERAREVLHKALRDHDHGVLIVGSGEISEQSQMELAEAALTLTEHCGPAARIMPRTRSTYSKYWDVPAAIAELPFLPSIQSAYDQGFRRMVLYGNYNDAEVMLAHPDVLYISAGWGCYASELLLQSSRRSRREERDLLECVRAILAVVPLSGDQPEIAMCDLYVQPQQLPPPDAKYTEVMKFIEAQRVIQWEQEFTDLVERFSVDELMHALRRDHMMPRMLDQLRSFLEAHVGTTEWQAPSESERLEKTKSEVREKLTHLIQDIRSLREKGAIHG